MQVYHKLSIDKYNLLTVLWPRTKFAITNYDFLCTFICDYLILVSSWVIWGSCLLECLVWMNMMLLVRILLIDSSLHKHVVMFTEFSLAWGQAKSKLGGSWYVQFASLFYIIICCYSLIYFIFGHNTYVISSILHDSWLLEDRAPEPGFCWKKHRQNAIFRKINCGREFYQKSYFSRWRREPEGGARRTQGGPTP